MLATVAWTEELLYRGYYLQNLSEGWNLVSAVILTSLIFPFGHSDLTVMDYLQLALAGLLLAFAYVRTRRLWLPIGLHLGWNFFRLSVFDRLGSFPFDVGLAPLLDFTSRAPRLAGLVSASGLTADILLVLAAMAVFLFTRDRNA